MNKTMAITTAGLAATVLSISLVGCGSDNKTESKTSTSASSSITTSSSAAPTSTKAPNAHMTIRDYIKENGIKEAPIKRGDPNAPVINLPVPDGWADAGKAAPPWAYGAIVFKSPANPADPPSIIAIVSKLTGNVDPAKILEYAPGELDNLTGFKGFGAPQKKAFSGFDAVQLGGTYMKDGKQRLVGQKTVVIPGKDGTYVLQMNADAVEGQEMPLMEATAAIDKQTTITP